MQNPERTPCTLHVRMRIEFKFHRAEVYLEGASLLEEIHAKIADELLRCDLFQEHLGGAEYGARTAYRECSSGSVIESKLSAWPTPRTSG